jgi:hypothetical protein
VQLKLIQVLCVAACSAHVECLGVSYCTAFLQVLDLCCNQIKRLGALAVARSIAKARAGSSAAPFELLALDENGISEAGIEQLKQMLKVSTPGCALQQSSTVLSTNASGSNRRQVLPIYRARCFPCGDWIWLGFGHIPIPCISISFLQLNCAVCAVQALHHIPCCW